jgi:hypothetical protein
MAQVSANVSGLTQHISRLHPDKDAARLSLYNYLKNLSDPSHPVDSELINAFYRRALSFAHWQQNKAALFNEVESLLSHFQESIGQRLDLRLVFKREDLQVIPAENLQHIEPILQKFLAARIGADKKYRLLRNSEFGYVAIILHPDLSLSVVTFDSNLVLMKGEIEPLSADLALHYTKDLELNPQSIQTIELGSHAFARFHLGVEGLRGVFVRGYTFQKFGSLDGGSLNRYPLLFYPLKRLEQFFVARESDQTYLELVGALEKAQQLLVHPTPDTIRVAQAAFERGRLAVEHIYPDYNLLRLLNDLEKSLAQAPTRNGATSIEIKEPHSGALAYPEPEGVDLLAKYDSSPSELKDDPWPEIRNLPV